MVIAHLFHVFLLSQVDMEKLVVYSMDDGGVNILTVAMDDQLKTAQRRVRIYVIISMYCQCTHICMSC